MADPDYKLMQRLGKMEESIPRRIDGGGGGGHDDGMETRIAALEKGYLETRDRLIKIETKMDALASKEDLHRETHSQTWRIIGVAALLVAVVYYLAKYVH
ncbi:hypothetical protein SAMN05445504_2403 [Burkholderia sp. CF099]|nr:hypothetical protein SAMN05445504_2403 [Burkholderia sp. CF099]